MLIDTCGQAAGTNPTALNEVRAMDMIETIDWDAERERFETVDYPL
jgi:hypothetical protein